MVWGLGLRGIEGLGLKVHALGFRVFSGGKGGGGGVGERGV